MPTGFNQQQVRFRTALLLFLKGTAAPLVLYFEKTNEVYAEFQNILKSGVATIIEKDTIGPIKKFTVQSSQISASALQEEQYV